jgi:hypothetical protein
MTDEAQTAVLAQLELAYERHAVAEQVTLGNDPELAIEYQTFAKRVLRARMAEEEDPKPKEATIHCLNCAAAYAAGGT